MFLWPTQAKAWAMFSWPFGPLSWPFLLRHPGDGGQIGSFSLHFLLRHPDYGGQIEPLSVWVSPALTGLNLFLWPTQAKAWATFSWPFLPRPAVASLWRGLDLAGAPCSKSEGGILIAVGRSGRCRLSYLPGIR